MKLEVAFQAPQPTASSTNRPLRILCDDDFIRQSLDRSMFDTSVNDRSHADVLWFAHTLFKGTFHSTRAHQLGRFQTSPVCLLHN